MELNEYQRKAVTTAKYPEDTGLIYTTLGLASEAGEVAGKVKKAIRDENCVITDERRQQLVSELGDVLWYVAMVAVELNTTLDIVAQLNLAKLSDRNTRDAISGDGDNR